MKAHNGPKKDEMYTPKWLYEPLGPFDNDYCASPTTQIAANNYTKQDNGLAMQWDGFVFCNPPFATLKDEMTQEIVTSKEMWIAKNVEHNNSILLLPSSCDAPWYGPLAQHCKQVFLIGQRVNFIGSTSSNYGGTTLFPLGDLALERIKASGLPGMLVTVEQFTPRKKYRGANPNDLYKSL